MQRIFTACLIGILLLTLAACGEPGSTTADLGSTPAATTNIPSAAATAAPTTQPAVPESTAATTTIPETIPTTAPKAPETVDLVVSYEVDSGMLLGNQQLYGYRMDFTYDEGYRNGSVTLTIDGETVNGTFTTDEHYNINQIQFIEDGATACFQITFDDQHRKLSAQSYVEENGVTDVRYEEAFRYDEQGRTVYTKREYPGQTGYISEVVYDEAGRTLEQKATNFDGSTGYTSLIRYEYDENGFYSAINYYDGDGNLIMSIPFTSEPDGEYTRCTGEMDGAKMVMLMDANGKCIRTEMHNQSGVYNWIENRYDDQGRLIWQQQWNQYSDKTITTEYAYTEDNRLIHNIQTSDGVETVVQRTTFQTVEIPE